jgi:murein L,D-transpeptidase YafK
MNITRRRGTIALLTAALFGGPTMISQEQGKVVADSIVVSKSAHTLSLMSGKTVLKTYQVALGRGSANAKQVEGDNRTPEGK